MGTGIIAVATSSLPVNLPGRRGIALTFWLLAVTLLAVLVTAFAVHWIRHTEHAREYARSSTMFPSTARCRWPCSPSVPAPRQSARR